MRNRWTCFAIVILFLTCESVWSQNQESAEAAPESISAAAPVGVVKAATKKPGPNTALKATIKVEQAYIFTKPDFDAEVLTVLGPGPQAFSVSRGKTGPFHKIRLTTGQIGYVLDSDIQFLNPPKRKKTNSEAKKKSEVRDPRKKSFMGTRFLGPAVQLVNYTESTMGKDRSQSLPFYGVRWSGLGTFFMDRSTYTDANLLIRWGAPSYYEDATTNSAAGWILLTDMLLEFTQMQTRSVMSYFGIGPMFRYSHINSSLNVGSTKTEYSLDDMVLGAAFNLGMAFELGKYAVRLDGKYYWEKSKYWAVGLAFQWPL